MYVCMFVADNLLNYRSNLKKSTLSLSAIGFILSPSQHRTRSAGHQQQLVRNKLKIHFHVGYVLILDHIQKIIINIIFLI